MHFDGLHKCKDIRLLSGHMCIHMFSVKSIKQTLAIKNIKLILECMSSKTPQNLDNSLGKIQISSYTVYLILNCKRLCSYVKLTKRLPKKSSLSLIESRSENYKICVSSLISIILPRRYNDLAPSNPTSILDTFRNISA